MPRLALIHATRVAIDPIEDAARKLWPEVETISILDEGLAVDRRKSRELSRDLWGRIVGLARYAESAGSDGILFTCSAFGQAIEDAAQGSPIPIMKPNEAMFGAACSFGARIAMIYTFAPAAAGMEDEFRETTQSNGSPAVLTSHFCAGAMDAKRGGDHAMHDRLIAETAEQITGADAIMLAQFSMAGAAARLRQHTMVPILTSPEAAIAEMRRRMEAQPRPRAC